MKYTEVDKDGNIVRMMYTENSDAAVLDGYRLLPDRGHGHLQYEWWQQPKVVVPVRAEATEIEYEVCDIPQSVLAEKIRADRKDLLIESDWTQLPDAPLDEAQKTAWKVYRQMLRDLPLHPEFPYIQTIPTKP